MARLLITSEIYDETDFKCSSNSCDGKFISKFSFNYPTDNDSNSTVTDDDGDLIVQRKKKGVIEIEHHRSTDLSLVGLQVWRGALLLADYAFHCRKEFQNKNVLEVGSGVGLTGIAAAIYSQRVVCTDINLGGILTLIQNNAKRNEQLIRNKIDVMEMDFKCRSWSKELEEIVKSTDIIFAADVIYDDDLSEAFVETLKQLMQTTVPNRTKTVFIALEKRYVFTVADLDSAAPCFEYFLRHLSVAQSEYKWTMEYIPIDFPQYFEYERVKELVLMKLTL